MMRLFCVLCLILSVKTLYAHQPELSSIMIYDDKNGKKIAMFKGSLTGFEEEIAGKFYFKTPDDFKQLVIKHFEKNCLIMINNEVIKFKNSSVILGHETTLFAELIGVPQNIETFFIKNTFFKEIYGNQNELILIINQLPQKQYILNNENQHEVRLKVDVGNWVIEDSTNFFHRKKYFIGLGLVVFLGAITFVFLRKKMGDL